MNTKYFSSITFAFLLLATSAFSQKVAAADPDFNISNQASPAYATLNDENQSSAFYGSLGFSPMMWGLKRVPVATPAQGTFEPLSYKGWQGSIAFGAFISESLKVDVEGIFNKMGFNKSGSKAANTQLNLTAVMLNAYFNVPIIDKVAAYIGAGLGVGRQAVKDLKNFADVSADPSSLTVLAAQGKIGLLYNISNKIQVYGGGRVFGVIPNKGFSVTTTVNTTKNDYTKTLKALKDIMTPRSTTAQSKEFDDAFKKITDDRSVTNLQNEDLGKAPLLTYLTDVYESADFKQAQPPADKLSKYKDQVTAAGSGFADIAPKFSTTLVKSGDLSTVLFNLYKLAGDTDCYGPRVSQGLNALKDLDIELMKEINALAPSPNTNSNWKLYLPFVSYGPEFGIVISLG